MPEPVNVFRSACALQIIDGAEDAFVALDDQCRFIFANSAAERLFGVAEAELLGRSQWEAFPATVGTPLEATYRRVVAERAAVTVETVVGPSQKRCEVQVNPLNQGCLSVRFRDVTDRQPAPAGQDLEAGAHERTAEPDGERATELNQLVEALATERRRFQDVLDILPAYVVLLTPDYHVPFANRFFEERFGKSGGLRCFEYLFHRAEPCEICETYSVLKTMAPHRWEWTGPDNRNYDIFDFPFIDADGSTLILEMGLDITERKRMEAEVRSASIYARSLIEASLDPLVTISPEGQITDVNEATELITGAAREGLIGSDFSEYFTEPELARAGYRKVLAEGLVRDYPLTIRQVSRRTTNVLYNAVVFRNEAGQVQGVFAAARDVTERKRIEAELARYRQHLEELVRQRTSELEDANAHLQREIAERQRAAESLQHMTAELSRSNQELEEFAYVASHDLQEPLRAVAGYLGLIEQQYREQLDDNGRHYITEAVQGAARMHGLITALLALSRVGSQGQVFAPADLSAVLDEALQSLDPSVQEAGAKITRDPLPTLCVDARQMTQLFQNLIGNALKFRGEQPPEIHISAQAQPGQCTTAGSFRAATISAAAHAGSLWVRAAPSFPLADSRLRVRSGRSRAARRFGCGGADDRSCRLPQASGQPRPPPLASRVPRDGTPRVGTFDRRSTPDCGAVAKSEGISSLHWGCIPVY